ncbi:hypothetical protein JCM3765_000388 [Sporobolomyces pararoseus]
MRTTAATLAFALSSAYSVHAFAGTYPILAWSDHKLDSLSLLSTSSPSSSTPPQVSSSQQRTFSDEAPSTSDLCSLSSLLVVSVPGLHFSDLARLPLSSSSPAGISSSLAQAESTTTQPYVREHTLSQPLKLVRRFERECGANFESQHEKNLWSGDGEAKTIRIVQIDGLKDVELNSEGAESGRKQVMENADAAVSYHLANLASPHAVILTALPASYSSPRRLNTKQPHLHLNNQHKKNMKRQMLEPASTADLSDLPEEEQEFIDEVLEEIKEEQAFDNMMDRIQTHDNEASTAESSSSKSDIGVSEIITPEELISEEDEMESVESLEQSESEWDGEMLQVSPYSGDSYEDFKKGGKGEKNGTSIFEPEEKSGLLHRYVFFTPALVFALLVSLMVLIPTVLIAVQALTSIETPHGLETKMTGTVGIDPSKA